MLDAVAELEHAAVTGQLSHTGDLGYPPAGKLWIDRRPLDTVRGSDRYGQEFDVKDPQVKHLLSALSTEQLGHSRFDFHGGDGQDIFR